ncbi:hypothetical protein CK203_091317 [Vitis vinifera]|uniref:Uncharacterized protein n=1 Tax=Vitis vinifera TaxID=29760 RepID=A0A438CLG6_VITVI|nr:hypothetical protein CK203_091317 [Vitis vinifera]
MIELLRKDYPDLLDILVEMGEEKENQLFQCVRPIHLDDEVGNPNLQIAAHARDLELMLNGLVRRSSQ